MKKIVLMITVWTCLLLIVATPLVNGSKNKTNNKEYFNTANKEIRPITGDKAYNAGTITDRAGNILPAMTITENVPIADQYTNGGPITCTENLIFKMVYKPGTNRDVIDAEDKTKIPATNVVIAGQGFDMQVLLRADFLENNCKTQANYQLLYKKIIANEYYYDDNLNAVKNVEPIFTFKEQSVTMSVAITPSENMDAKFLTGSATDPNSQNKASIDLKPWTLIDSDLNGTFTEKAADISNRPFMVKYLIDQAWMQDGSVNTEYGIGAPENGWSKLGDLGYYYTKFTSCPKTATDASGNQTYLSNFFVLEYAYSPGGEYPTTVPNQQAILSTTKYGFAVGDYLVAQQLLVAGSRSACVNDDDQVESDSVALKNNFYYTTIDPQDPFNKKKFAYGTGANDLLNWSSYWNDPAIAALTVDQKWAYLATHPAVDNALVGRYIDFSDVNGPERLEEVAKLYKKSPRIVIGGYSSDFAPYLPREYNN